MEVTKVYNKRHKINKDYNKADLVNSQQTNMYNKSYKHKYDIWKKEEFKETQKNSLFGIS